MFKTNKEKILVILLVILSTFGISHADDYLDVKTYINNMRNATTDPGVLGNIFIKVFDSNGKIRDGFYSFTDTMTNGYLPLWDNGYLVNSTIYSDGVNVGIGTTTLTEKLTISGGISINISPDSGDDVGNRDYNDARYLGLFSTSADSNLFDGLDSSAFQTNIDNLVTCAYGISSVLDNGTVVCATNNDTTIADTNAGTICATGEYLDGDGTCITERYNSDYDTEAEIDAAVANNGYANSASSIPAGAVMAFYLSSCPTGWNIADGTNGTPDLRGTFIRGMNGDVNSRDTARILGDYQVDNYLSHLHSVNPPATNSGNQSANHVHSVNPPAKTTTSNGSHRHASSATSAFSALSFDNNDDGRRKDGANDGSYTGYAGTHAHTVDIGAFNSAGNNVSHTHSTNIPAFNSANAGGSETRPKNVALLYCVKY